VAELALETARELKWIGKTDQCHQGTPMNSWLLGLEVSLYIHSIRDIISLKAWRK
jgi:hypothetical protein